MRLLTLSGNIGVGKTTLGELIAKRHSAMWLPENAYSQMFQYLITDDKVESRVIMQMSFASMRVSTILSALRNQDNKLIVAERSLRDSLVFHRAWRNINGMEAYDDFFREFYKHLDHPLFKEIDETILKLTCTIDKSLERITIRDQISESAHTRELLELLEAEYKSELGKLGNVVERSTENLILNESGMEAFLNDIDKIISGSENT